MSGLPSMATTLSLRTSAKIEPTPIVVVVLPTPPLPPSTTTEYAPRRGLLTMALSARNRRSSGDCSIVTKPKVATRNHFRHPLADGILCSAITSAARNSSVVSSHEAASAVVRDACPARAVAGGAGVMDNGGLAAGGRLACDDCGFPVGGRLGFGGTCGPCCRCLVKAAQI